MSARLMGFALGIVLLPAALIAGALLLNRVPLADPPGPLARVTAYLTQNRVRTGPQTDWPERRSLPLAVSPEAFRARVGPVLEAAGWQRHPQHDDSLHWVVVSPLLRFSDDVTLELRRSDLELGWLDVEARSRVGKGDLGANTRHLIALRERLRAAGLVGAP